MRHIRVHLFCIERAFAHLLPKQTCQLYNNTKTMINQTALGIRVKKYYIFLNYWCIFFVFIEIKTIVLNFTENICILNEG